MEMVTKEEEMVALEKLKSVHVWSNGTIVYIGRGFRSAACVTEVDYIGAPNWRQSQRIHKLGKALNMLGTRR